MIFCENRYPLFGIMLYGAYTQIAWRDFIFLGLDEIGARGAEQFFHFFDCFADRFANYVVQLDLALQFNESFTCEIETLCHDCCNVQEYHRIFFEQLGARDAKLRGFQSSHVGSMRLI